MGSKDSNQSSCCSARPTRYITKNYCSLSKPYYKPTFSSVTPHYSCEKPAFCYLCKTIRPCGCDTSSMECESLPKCDSCQTKLCPPKCDCGKPLLYCCECRRIAPCDCNCLKAKCYACDGTLVAPKCDCGQPVYCIRCKKKNPCDNCKPEKPTCQTCQCYLVPPRCPCGQPTYCCECEEITPVTVANLIRCYV
ncbi:hypothetical protein M8J75_007155 [Diaphorina citri]|nr:hypothetical protein M8J75_007155 [Diaphorina citri]